MFVAIVVSVIHFGISVFFFCSTVAPMH